MENKICFRGKKVALRPFDVENDVTPYLEAINDPQYNQFFFRTPPVYEHNQRSWFRSLPTRTDTVFTIADFAGNSIGVVGLEKIDSVYGHAYIWTLIWDRTLHRQGIGTDVRMLIGKYGFDEVRLEKLCTEVLKCNIPSIKCNEKCGFEHEGLLRKHVYKNGRYHDVVSFAIFRDRFREFYDAYFGS